MKKLLLVLVAGFLMGARRTVGPSSPASPGHKGITHRRAPLVLRVLYSLTLAPFAVVDAFRWFRRSKPAKVGAVATLVGLCMGAALPRATYLKRNAFRDAQTICLHPKDPGQGLPVSAFDMDFAICPVADPTQIETPASEGCKSITILAVPATAGQKNWIKAAWSQANTLAAVPEAAQDAP